MSTTSKNIYIEEINRIPVNNQATEYVERKGIGHPDTLIDGICERASIELSKYYLNEVGSILHHNVDKGLIVGGASTATFSKGVITKPIEIIIAGRATSEFQGRDIPVDDIAIKAARDYLKENTRFLDLDTEIVINSKIQRGSADLMQIFNRNSGMPLANDTSFGIGFAPFSETERIAIEIEHYLNSKAYKTKMPSVGEDIKVMGIRENNKITLIIAVAFVARFINNIYEYIHIKENLAKDAENFAKKFTKRNIEIFVNTGDSHETNEIYLTKSGLSCEAGDDGEVGRGNRINGIITPFRQMSLEAAAGKNPVNHVGKIYNVLSQEIAKDIIKQYPQIAECNISIISQIGRSIADPKNLSIKVIMENGENFKPIQGKVNAIAEEKLNNIKDLTMDIVLGKYSMF
jgi:S-adenosylmethionine synthetase